MRRALLLCVLLLVGATVCPALFPTVKGTPAALPDLAIYPWDIVFWVDDTPTYSAPVGISFVNIMVYVDDKGLDNITSANVTLDINGSLFGVSPVVHDPAGEFFQLDASFLWNTSSLPAGNYTIRAQVNDSAGEADPTDNTAEINFTIAPHPPVLKLELDAPVVETAVTEKLPGLVSVNGTVNVADLFGQRLVINISGITDTGWDTQISPTTVVADKEGSFSFSVTVVVPEGAWVDRPGKVTVFANASTVDVSLNVSAETYTTVSSYFGMEVDVEKRHLDIAPGDDCTFTVKLTNRGNGDDSFLLEVINQKDLEQQHASANVSRQRIENLGPGESATFKVFFRSSKDWTIWKQEPSVVILKTTSLGARENQKVIARTDPLYAYEKGSYPAWYSCSTVGLIVIILIVAVAAGFWNRRRKRKKTGVPAA